MSRDLARDVDEALQQDRYDLPLFLRFLKSYVMAGTQPDKKLLLGVLLQTLPRFQCSDFSACISLVPGHVQDAHYIEKELGLIYDLENYLSCGRFVQFWEVWGEAKDLLAAAPSFESQVRAGILVVVASTLEKVPVAKMATYLGVSPDQLPSTLSESARIAGDAILLLSCDAETVSFAKSIFNAPESDSNQQPLRFSDIVSIVS
ncbi:hypothetical protein TRSC58_02078 [Trypanosoma rangeli SC58]|uniref:CSN8/PSMD8/EIF3K domain-containing protein n=1 Tax=Trypanosoma rangeli SC58 TaxID=429131 RepID=A0A061J427_TRYRA|nr:hypothetical protein TRSC58_02078 [Trypanosoma rangeli SC58]